MKDILEGWVAIALSNLPSASVLFNIIFLIVIAWFVVHSVNRDDNDMQWSEAISTRGPDGKEHFDWNKVGQGCGVILAMTIPYMYVHTTNMEALGLGGLVTVSLGYLGAVSSYSAWLRSKQGGIETTKVTEFTPPARVTETKTETPPLGDKEK